MFNVSRYDTFNNVKSNCYIASKLGQETDDYGNKNPIYDEPNKEPYRWNIQNISQRSEALTFGERILQMKVATIVGEEKEKYLGKFHEYDLAYLDGNTPEGEVVNGQNANYRIYAVRPQNVALLIYFEKIV